MKMKKSLAFIGMVILVLGIIVFAYGEDTSTSEDVQTTLQVDHQYNDVSEFGLGYLVSSKDSVKAIDLEGENKNRVEFSSDSDLEIFDKDGNSELNLSGIGKGSWIEFDRDSRGNLKIKNAKILSPKSTTLNINGWEENFPAGSEATITDYYGRSKVALQVPEGKDFVLSDGEGNSYTLQGSKSLINLNQGSGGDVELSDYNNVHVNDFSAKSLGQGSKIKLENGVLTATKAEIQYDSGIKSGITVVANEETLIKNEDQYATSFANAHVIFGDEEKVTVKGASVSFNGHYTQAPQGMIPKTEKYGVAADANSEISITNKKFNEEGQLVMNFKATGENNFISNGKTIRVDELGKIYESGGDLEDISTNIVVNNEENTRYAYFDKTEKDFKIKADLTTSAKDYVAGLFYVEEAPAEEIGETEEPYINTPVKTWTEQEKNEFYEKYCTGRGQIDITSSIKRTCAEIIAL